MPRLRAERPECPPASFSKIEKVMSFFAHNHPLCGRNPGRLVLCPKPGWYGNGILCVALARHGSLLPREALSCLTGSLVCC